MEATVLIVNPLNMESDIPGSSLMLIDTSSAKLSSKSNPPTSVIDRKCLSLFFYVYVYIPSCDQIYQVMFCFPLCLFTTMIPCSCKKASIPTVASLATSLPLFQHPFTTTTVPRSLELASSSDKETLGKDRSHLM